ncbi:hypothetical protein CK203_046153 [Vitis vinifera]|uniref:Uncharacterized protein n=1 Tax=Vitis vinifera TaxID=29760 RepID=A0A438I4D0_VITVI|nr:hypothetical protein CK203_046153 [Vitis vinifera]
MLTQPPIEGNLDCRARPFHSELCFDTATFQLRPELAQSFHLAKIPHGWSASAFAERYLLSDKWNNMTTYRVDQPERPQPAARRASPRHIPEGIPMLLLPISQDSTSYSSFISAIFFQLSRGWPFLFLSIGSYGRSLQILTASQSILTQQITVLSAHQEQIIATQTQHIIWLLYHLLSTPFLSHQSHHRPLLLYIRLCLLRSRLQERQRQLSHHLHIILQPPSDHFHTYESIQACQMMEELLGQVMAKLLEAQIHEETKLWSLIVLCQSRSKYARKEHWREEKQSEETEDSS